MPNHFVTIGLCGRDCKRMELLGKEDYDEIDLKPIEGANLCELISKLPEELEGIVATNPKCRYRHKETGQWSSRVELCELILMGDDRDQYEKVELSWSEVAELVLKYGAADWFDWQVKNWGTKWGIYDTKVYKLDSDGSPVLIEFQTAWNPPTPEMMRKIDDYLCETYCLKNIRWIGHNPYDNSTVDIAIAGSE